MEGWRQKSAVATEYQHTVAVSRVFVPSHRTHLIRRTNLLYHRGGGALNIIMNLNIRIRTSVQNFAFSEYVAVRGFEDCKHSKPLEYSTIFESLNTRGWKVCSADFF